MPPSELGPILDSQALDKEEKFVADVIMLGTCADVCLLRGWYRCVSLDVGAIQSLPLKEKSTTYAGAIRTPSSRVGPFLDLFLTFTRSPADLATGGVARYT